MRTPIIVLIFIAAILSACHRPSPERRAELREDGSRHAVEFREDCEAWCAAAGGHLTMFRFPLYTTSGGPVCECVLTNDQVPPQVR